MTQETARKFPRKTRWLRRFQELCFRRGRQTQLPTWGALAMLVAAETPLLVGYLTAPPPALAVVQAARILTIAPACADPGDVVQLTGRGFGAENIRIFVDTLPVVVLSAYGNLVTFLVPTEAPGGVTTVCDTQPGQHQGCITFRVRSAEVCGNQIDEDCDGKVDDTDMCASVNHSPVADAGPDQTAPVGTTVQFDGNGSSDPDGDTLSFQWVLISHPSSSTATVQAATTATPTLTLDVAGSYTFQLMVSDGSLIDTDTVVVSTNNSAPVANAGPDKSGRVGDMLTLQGDGSFDRDGDSLTYQWNLESVPAGSMTTLSDPHSVTSQISLDVFGDYVVQLVVNDGTTDSQPDTVTLSTINSLPVADAGPDQSHPSTTLVTLDGSRSHDVDGNPLTYQWSLVSMPAGSTATLSNITNLTPTFSLDLPGTYVAQLIVNDGLASSQPDTVTLSTINSPPVANAGLNQSHPVGALVTLDGGDSHDVDGNLLSFLWSLVSTPVGSTATLSDPTNLSPTFTLDLPGTYVAQLIVNDGSVSSQPDTVTLSTINSPPVANAGLNQSHPVGALVTLDGKGSSNVDGDTLLYFWALLWKPTGSTTSLSDPTAVRPTFTMDLPGQYVMQLIVTDGTWNSQPDTVTITTENSPPVANAGPDQTGAMGAPLMLNGTGSQDADGDPLTYRWSLLSRPPGSTVTFSNPTTAQPILTLDETGSYLVQLIVSDGTVESQPDTVTISTINSSPVADAGPDQAVLTGAVVQLHGGGSHDMDSDSLTYQWALIALPTGSTAVLLNPRSVTSTFTPDLPGEYVAQLIVHDGTVDSDPATTMIVATEPDTTPPAAPDTDKITTSPATNGQTTVTGEAGSVEGGSIITITNTRTQESVFKTANADGSFMTQIGAQGGDELTIVAADSTGNTSATVTIMVNSLRVFLSSPSPGSTVQEGSLLVTGTLEGGDGEVGVTVNDAHAAVNDATFMALVPVTPATTSLLVRAVSATGMSATTTLALMVLPATQPTPTLSVSPLLGSAPLTVNFLLLSEPTEVTQVTLDVDGDGHSEFSGATLNEQLFTYTLPGLYVPTATVTDAQGQQVIVHGLVQVYDQLALDALLQAKWATLKEALRRGDIPWALTQIHSQARARYEAIFQTLMADLPEVDSILTSITLLEVRGGEALYEMVRTDDTIVKSFELRFRIDEDGIWRMAMF